MPGMTLAMNYIVKDGRGQFSEAHVYENDNGKE